MKRDCGGDSGQAIQQVKGQPGVGEGSETS